MQKFDSKIHSEKIDTYIKTRIKHNQPKGELLIILVGDNPASVKYIGVKMKLCENLGVPVRLEEIDPNLSDTEILTKIENLFTDPKVAGGIIQLPLPRESLTKALEIIPTYKDADLISSTNIQRFYASDFSRLPPVVRAFNYFLLNALLGDTLQLEKYIDQSMYQSALQNSLPKLKGYIIGNGFLVGRPLAHYLNSFTTPIQSTENYTSGTKIYSDFLVLGAGHPNLIAGEDISAKCNVIDFGTTVVDGKIVGDLNKNSKCDHLGLVSFSPGGIGPIVVRFLIINFLDLQ